VEEFNVKSNDHFKSMKDELWKNVSNKDYFDISVVCSNGTMRTNRFFMGVIFPQITDEGTVLMPDYSTTDISVMFKKIFNNLTHIPGYIESGGVSEQPQSTDPDIREVLPPSNDPLDPDSQMILNMKVGDTDIYTAPPPQATPPVNQQTSHPKMEMPHFLDERYITKPEEPKQSIVTNVIQQPTIHPQQIRMPNGGGFQRMTVRAPMIQLPRTVPPNTMTVNGQYLLQTTGPLPPGSQLIRCSGATQYFTLKQPIQGMVVHSTATSQFNGIRNTAVQRNPSPYAMQPMRLGAPATTSNMGNQVLVTTASHSSTLNSFITSKSNSLLSAKSIKESINPSKKPVIADGKVVGWMSEKSQPASTSASVMKKVIPKSLIYPKFPVEDIEEIEPRRLYMVNKRQSKIKLCDIKCKKVKLNAEQLEEVEDDKIRWKQEYWVKVHRGEIQHQP